MSEFPLERAWVVDCGRCANEGTSYELTHGEAMTDLRRQGWTSDDGYTYCPACSATKGKQ